MRADGKMANLNLVSQAFEDDNDSLSGMSGISEDESLHSATEPSSKRPRQESGWATTSKNRVDLTQPIMPVANTLGYCRDGHLWFTECRE